MSPAGYWPQLRAAIEAGADSVYFGLQHFTARAKVGFSVEELPEVMRTLHRRGVTRIRHFQHAGVRSRNRSSGTGHRGHRRGRRGRHHRAGFGHGEAGAADRAGPGNSRQHADERHQRGRGAAGPKPGRAPRDAGARAFARRDSRHSRRHGLRAGDLRARRAVRGVFGAVPLFRGVGRAQRQSRAVRAGVPAALRDDGGRRAPAAGRRPLPALAGRSDRAAADSGDRRDRDCGVEDRGPLQGRRLRGAGHARLPPGGG